MESSHHCGLNCCCGLGSCHWWRLYGCQWWQTALDQLSLHQRGLSKLEELIYKNKIRLYWRYLFYFLLTFLSCLCFKINFYSIEFGLYLFKCSFKCNKVDSRLRMGLPHCVALSNFKLQYETSKVLQRKFLSFWLR